MVCETPEQVAEALHAALDPARETPALQPPSEPLRLLLRDVRALSVVRGYSDADLVRLFNTYCRNQEGELSGIPSLIADEMCSRVDPGWEERTLHSTNETP